MKVLNSFLLKKKILIFKINRTLFKECSQFTIKQKKLLSNTNLVSKCIFEIIQISISSLKIKANLRSRFFKILQDRRRS